MTNQDIEETSYAFHGNPFASLQSMALMESFRRSMALTHKLPTVIASMMGMSGRKYRYLINNYVSLAQNPRYLEIGSWLGSTACSAIYGNRLKLTCIDNWSQFEGPKDTFLANINVTRNPHTEFAFIESDFRLVDYGALGLYNIYMFDGPHDENDQYDGIMITQQALESEYLLVVDDWNLVRVRDGTLNALRDTNTSVQFAIEIRTTHNNLQPTKARFQDSEWHNGYYIAACGKRHNFS